MNILFIGGAGFIGSSLVKRFISDEKHSVFILEPEFADISRLKDYNLTVFRSSLSNINEVKNILLTNKIEVVVHLVSTLIPGSTYDDYIGEFKNVIFPSIKLMEFCANEDIKFVYFSSGGTIYGNRTTFQPFVETDSMEPISYYGWSKQMMENSILFKNRTQKLKFLIVRPSNPYGHGQNLYGKQGLVAVAIGKIIENKPVEVWGDGSAIRDYIYIEDLANIFYQLINKDVCNETINLGSGRGFSVNDVLAFLKIISKADFKIEYKNARPVDVSNMVLDIEKMKQFGWNVNWTEKRKHITFQNQDGKKVRDSNLSKTFHLDISKEGLENEFNGNREKSRVAADRDSRANEELRNYYRELDAAITDTRGITDQAQSGEGYSRTKFRKSERVHANTEKADTDTGRRETDNLIRQAEIARRNSEINRRNSASDNRTVRNAEAESVASAEQRRSEKQKWLNEQERARAARRRNKRRSGPEL